MKFLFRIVLSLCLLLILNVDLAVAEDESVEVILKKFKLMQNTFKDSDVDVNEVQKSDLTRDKIQDFINSAKDSNQPINIGESLGSNLSGLNLSGMDFSNTIMYHVNFSGANLDDCIFTNAFLEGVNFENASLKGSTFINTNISRANLTKANLTNSKLSKT